MKKYLLFCFIILTIFLGSYHYGYLIRNYQGIFEEDGIKQVSRVTEDYFEVYSENKWEKVFLKGVNMGTAKPGYFPGEFGVTKEEYLRWFKQIEEMNANVIRVYTLQSPAFYEALYEHNRYTKNPLYIIHGVWVNEENMMDTLNAFDPLIMNSFKEDIVEVIDAIHGNLVVGERAGEAYGEYKRDISPYIMGYILGIEWDPYFVQGTNDNNQGYQDFQGEYVFTTDAAPIEVFFAQMIEHAITYETDRYQMQHPIAMTNWVTTDAIDHKKDLEEDNMLVNIDVEHIKATDLFKSRLFVSYHVYPYYPDFLNYDNEYANFVDESGEKNSYLAYLRKLKSYHKQPIVISEFGIPTSRGITHQDLVRGFNQGMVSEDEQARMNVTMLNEIYDEGYAGAIVFSWQDEWFKRTWNTMDFDDADARPYWSDRMTNEKYFGILSFDAGTKGEQIYLDGDVSDWDKKDFIAGNEEMKLYMRSDESYVYIRIHKENLDLSKGELIIPIDVTPSSGTRRISGSSLTFNKGADFYICIDEEEKATFYVQDYYDLSEFLNNKLTDANSESENFNIYTQVILGKSIHPETKEDIPLQRIEVGQLIQGISNPNSTKYNSLSDYYIEGDEIEIRIPWLMLNISNPARKLIVGDVYQKNEFYHTNIEQLYVGCYIDNDDEQENNIRMVPFTWEEWDMPSYFERLKPSYYALKETFLNLK